jgi:broad specificity phosphatase PhoE
MKTLTYIRHGESVSNAGGLTMAHEAIPLSELGHTQARGLAQALGVQPSRVLVSRLVRTHQTAQPFCERFGVLPEQDARLDEFSVIDPALIAGLTGAERKPFVKAYWDDPDPSKRLGRYADTFAEFADRVDQFMRHMNNLPDATVIFGHGIWFGLLLWRLLGYSANDITGMRAFRRFQLGLPMPNCATFSLRHSGGDTWSVRAGLLHGKVSESRENQAALHTFNAI